MASYFIKWLTGQCITGWRLCRVPLLFVSVHYMQLKLKCVAVGVLPQGCEKSEKL
jgi:hypothetical protein